MHEAVEDAEGALRKCLPASVSGTMMVTRLVGETAFAVAKASNGIPELTGVYLDVLMNGLRRRDP
ncbi:hypothetical protein GCM10009853_032430 [Glycomyces scopariae]